MKKLLFVIPSFSIGGTNTSLINLLANIDKSQYSCYVYAINNEGILRDQIAPLATILNKNTEGESNQGKSFNISIKKLPKKIFRFIRSCGVDLSPLYYHRVAKSWKQLGFNTVIAFQEGNVTQLVSYCDYTKRVAWVRSEYGRYLKVNKKKPEAALYDNIDIIINVSETARKNFVEYLPQYSSKTYAVYNLLNSKRVKEKSAIDINIPGNNDFTIVSLGRVDPVKHFTEIPQIAKELVENGVKFRWLIIGGKTETTPEEYDKISKDIITLKLEDVVYQTGYQPNPYAYLNKSDLLVCLSESETFNHTFAEARLLGIPVLTVDYPSAHEMIRPGEGGRIITRDAIANELKKIVCNQDYYGALKDEVKFFSYDNMKILNNLYELL